MTETDKSNHPPYAPDEARAIRDREFWDTRNVLDEFKGQPHEEIMAIAEQRRSDLVVMASNRLRDFSWGTVVRSSHCLGARECVFTSSRRFDRRGAVGAQNYTSIRYIQDPLDAITQYRCDGYQIVAIEYDERYADRMVSLYDHTFERKTLIILGEEGRTLDDDILDASDRIVMIPMLGVLRSLNVATAATSVMVEYNRQQSLSE